MPITINIDVPDCPSCGAEACWPSTWYSTYAQGAATCQRSYQVTLRTEDGTPKTTYFASMPTQCLQRQLDRERSRNARAEDLMMAQETPDARKLREIDNIVHTDDEEIMNR